MEVSWVVFKLGKAAYAVDLQLVDSILKMQSITHLPQAPAFIEGLAYLRGRVLPVIDLHTCLNLPKQEVTSETRLVVVTLRKTTVALLVDQVDEVMRIGAEDIRPSDEGESYLWGTVLSGSTLVTLLDVGQLMAVDETTMQASQPLVV